MDALLGKEGAKGRRHLVQQDNGKGGNYGFRAGKWKLQRHDSKRRHNVHVTTQLQFQPAPHYSLFDLSKDVQEKKNIAEEHPKVLERMKQRLQKIIDAGRSRP
jgi:arylsulfatase A